MRYEFIAIILTFIFGLFIGFYIYLTEFSVLLHKFSNFINKPKSKTGLTIYADSYGGCHQSCASFKIDINGKYHYFYFPTNAIEPVVREGVLPKALLKDLHKFLTLSEVKKQSRKITPEGCYSYADGIDVVYKINFGGDNEYTLDSCGTDIDKDSELWKVLSRAWEYQELVND